MATPETKAVTDQQTYGGMPTGAGPFGTASPQQHGLTPAPAMSPGPDGIGAAPPQYSVPAYSETKGQQQQQQQPQDGSAPGMVPMVVPLQMLQGEMPMWIDCPFCMKRALTQAKSEGTSMQVLTGVLLCLICLPLACLPCCAGWFEDTIYSCSSCKKAVARRFHDGGIEVYSPTALMPSAHPK